MWWAAFLRWIGHPTESAELPPEAPSEEAPTEEAPSTNEPDEEEEMDKPELAWADDANGNVMPLLIAARNDDAGTVSGFIFADTENGFGISKGTMDLREHLKPGGRDGVYQA